MAGSPTTIRPRKRPFPLGCAIFIVALCLGFWGGIAATKWALTAPQWVQKAFGIPASPPVVVRTAPPAGAPPALPASPPPAAPAATPTASPDDNAGATPAPIPGDAGDKPAKPQNHRPAKIDDLAGTWASTDTVAGGGKMNSAYIFRADNTGEYDANGQKLYDLKWQASGDELSLDFDGQGPDLNQAWNAGFRWSLNDDRSVLTLVPTSGRDPRSYVYSLGPGVYHRKRP